MKNKLIKFLDSFIEFFRKFPVLKKIPKSFYRFFIIGLSVFVLDLIIFSFLFHVLGLKSKLDIIELTPKVLVKFNYANMISLFLASIYGYIANKTWSFEDKGDNVASQFSKYVLVAAINFLINNTIFGLLIYEIFSDPNNVLITSISKVLATSFQTISSYILYKYIVFRADKEVISESTV